MKFFWIQGGVPGIETMWGDWSLLVMGGTSGMRTLFGRKDLTLTGRPCRCWWPPCSSAIHCWLEKLDRYCARLGVRTTAADSCKSHSCLTGVTLSDHAANWVFSIYVNLTFTNSHAETAKSSNDWGRQKFWVLVFAYQNHFYRTRRCSWVHSAN